MDNLKVADFEALLNEEFTISLCSNAGEIKGTLYEVKESPNPTPDEFRTPFSLMFKCAPGSVIASGCHKITHEKLSLDAVYLEALLPDEECIYYQVVFS